MYLVEEVTETACFSNFNIEDGHTLETALKYLVVYFTYTKECMLIYGPY